MTIPSNNRNIGNINPTHRNIKPNKDLTAPEIFPPYVGQGDETFPFFIKIPNYPHVKAGDTVSINIEGAATSGFIITDQDIKDEIIIYLDRENIPADKITAGENIEISYQVENNDNYEDDNLSLSSHISVIENSKTDLPKTRLFQDTRLPPDENITLSRYKSIIGINKEDLNDINIKEAYLLLFSREGNFYYCDSFNTDQGDVEAVFLIESLKIYKLAGEEISAWIVLLEENNGVKILHSTPLGKIIPPTSMEMNCTVHLPTTHEMLSAKDSVAMYDNFVHLYINGKELIKSNDVLYIDGPGLKGVKKLVLTDKLINSELVIPIISNYSPDYSFGSPTYIIYTIIQKKGNLVSGTLVWKYNE